MDTCDFGRSFIRWRLDVEKKPPVTVSHKPPFTVNNVRMPLECRAELTDLKTGQISEYGMGTACKSERVSVTEDIWDQPNSDMRAIASRDEFLICKQWDKCDKGVMLHPASLGPQPERQVVNPAEVFDSSSLDVKMRSGKELNSVSEVVEALFSEKPIVSRTEYANDAYRVMLEYPVKCVNFSERDNYWQVDTGPVLYADFSKGHKSLIEVFQLAFVAHNCPDWAEFIVNVPTPVGDGISVHHYSKSERVDAKNSMIVIE